MAAVQRTAHSGDRSESQDGGGGGCMGDEYVCGRKQHPWDWPTDQLWTRRRSVRSDSQDWVLSNRMNVLPFT